MCTSILPGPKEQNPDQIQRYLRPIVSDLLRLWKFGIKVPTESCPEGDLVFRHPTSADVVYMTLQVVLFVLFWLPSFVISPQHTRLVASHPIHIRVIAQLAG